MTEKPGVATRLMYQLFVALNRKKVKGEKKNMHCMCVCMRERERERVGGGRGRESIHVSVCISVVLLSKGS